MKSPLKCGATYSETTSDGKVWGTDRTFSHRALSLVQVHPAGHLGCLTLRPSATAKLTAATQTRSVHPFHPLHPLTALPGYPIPSVPVEDNHSCTCNFSAKSSTIRNPGSSRLYEVFLVVFCPVCFNDRSLVLLRSDAGWCLCFLRLNRKGTSPADSFCKAQDYKCGTDRTWERRTDSDFFFGMKGKRMISASRLNHNIWSAPYY